VSSATLRLADVAARFEAAPPAGGADAASAQLSALMGAATRGILGMRASDPRARAAMRFVLQLGADALTTAARDAPGGALLALLGSMVEGAPYDGEADAALGAAELRECYAIARRRAAARGWRLPGAPAEDGGGVAGGSGSGSGSVAAGVSASSAAAPAPMAEPAEEDVDAALSDAFAYALLVYWSRVGA
jgi:hypothetical protein